MNKVYFSQIDSRWKNHPYPAPNGYENKTIGTSGCGPTCSAMVVSMCKEVVTPDAMGDILRQNGFRVPGGTDIDAYPFVAKKWGIEYKRLKSSYEAHQACKEGWLVIINVANGLWTTGGHYILAVGANNSEIEIYDPYLYSGKFNRYGRSGKVRMEGVSAWVNIDTFKAYSNAQKFFAFKIPDRKRIAHLEVKLERAPLRSATEHMDRNIIAYLPEGTPVDLLAILPDYWGVIAQGYINLRDFDWKPMEHVKTKIEKAPLRKAPGHDAEIITYLDKGTEFDIIEYATDCNFGRAIQGWINLEDCN